MGKEIITFGDIEIKNRKFHHCKNLILLDVNIAKIQVLSMVSRGQKNYKYFIGYKDDDPKMKPLCMFSKISAYVKSW